MAETLRELVAALLLDFSNFSRNMRTINQQIREAESTFRLPVNTTYFRKDKYEGIYRLLPSVR